MKRIYHRYDLWEEYNSAMWVKAKKEDEPGMLKLAIEFTGDHLRYGAAMRKVIEQWKYSCENALTDKSLNKQAWIGHAACALELNIPEYIVREAWKLLTDEQRKSANKQADMYIKIWKENHVKSKQLRLQFYER